MPAAQGDAAAVNEGMRASEDDLRVIAALRAKDDAAFAQLVDRYGASLVRLARIYVRDPAVADEVVQDAWIGLLESLDRFEGRSSLKTWLFRILLNCARSRARKDARTIPFSLAFRADEREDAVPGFGRFVPDWVPRLGGHWVRPPARWQDEPEQRTLAAETETCIRRAIDALPPAQREVITLRDLVGFDAGEVCNALGITDTNQRVILHRARAKVRVALERLFAEATT
jgi:RNA polymerase sigma-70 factor (ECF subfamily)